MKVLCVCACLLSQIFATNSQNDFFKKIPEYGTASVRFKKKSIPEIKAKEGAVLEDVTSKNIEVKKLFFAKKLKANRIFLNDCMAFLQDGFVDLLEGLAVLQIENSIVTKIKIKGHVTASFLKSNLITAEGQCFLNDSEIKNMNVASDKTELKNTKVDCLKIKFLKEKTPIVALKNSTVRSIIFIGTAGKVIKRDHESTAQTVENGTQEFIFF